MEWLNKLLKELETRYKVGEEFSKQVKPIAEKILSPDIPDSKRQELLTLLAETYERQAEVTKNLKIAKEAFEKFFKDLATLLRIAISIKLSNDNKAS